MPWRRRAGYQFGNLQRVVTPAAASVSFWARFLLALRILFDGALAARLTRSEPPVLPPPASSPEVTESAPDSEARVQDRANGALALLSLLQTDGRLVDFLEQDVASFSDGDIGAAARVVHEGCRKTLRAHADLERLRSEAEGTSVTLAPGFDGTAIRLTGNVRGEPPYRGVLRHAGWRVRAVKLPTTAPGHDPHVIATAEVEL